MENGEEGARSKPEARVSFMLQFPTSTYKIHQIWKGPTKIRYQFEYYPPVLVFFSLNALKVNTNFDGEFNLQKQYESTIFFSLRPASVMSKP